MAVVISLKLVYTPVDDTVTAPLCSTSTSTLKSDHPPAICSPPPPPTFMYYGSHADTSRTSGAQLRASTISRRHAWHRSRAWSSSFVSKIMQLLLRLEQLLLRLEDRPLHTHIHLKQQMGEGRERGRNLVCVCVCTTTRARSVAS